MDCETVLKPSCPGGINGKLSWWTDLLVSWNHVCTKVVRVFVSDSCGRGAVRINVCPQFVLVCSMANYFDDLVTL